MQSDWERSSLPTGESLLGHEFPRTLFVCPPHDHPDCTDAASDSEVRRRSPQASALQHGLDSLGEEERMDASCFEAFACEDFDRLIMLAHWLAPRLRSRLATSLGYRAREGQLGRA